MGRAARGTRKTPFRRLWGGRQKQKAAKTPSRFSRRVAGKLWNRQGAKLPSWVVLSPSPPFWPHQSKGRRGFTSLWSRTFVARRGCKMYKRGFASHATEIPQFVTLFS